MPEKKLLNLDQKLKTWYESPLGQHLIKLEKNAINDIADGIFCYDTLIIGDSEFLEDIEKLRNTNIFFINEHNTKPVAKTNVKTIKSIDYKLPLASESMDFIYLSHALEFSKNPHDVLREAYRVLRPEGNLIITSFNNISLWGIIRLFLKFTNSCPWTGNFSSTIKITDWLNLLGFNVVNCKNYFYNLPINNTKYLEYTSSLEWLGKNLALPFGANFIVLANKKIEGITPVMPSWKERKNILKDQGVVIPTPNCEAK